MGRSVAGGAIFSVARRDLRRHWRTLVVLGILAGLVGGAVVGALAVARRTATAYDRLARASGLEDVRVRVLDPADVPSVRRLPEVQTAWTSQLAVGRLEGEEVTFAGVLSGPPRPEGLFDPVVVRGRAPAPDAADEVLLNEEFARSIDKGPGARLRLDMLTHAEVEQFDTGFGDPDGPTITLSVTGVARVPTTGASSAPIIATSEFARAYGELAAGPIVLAQLEHGAASIPAFARALDALSRVATPPAVTGSDFTSFAASYPSHETERLDAATGVLVTGLLVFALVALIAGLVLCVLAFGRHHGADAGAQRIERVVGMTRSERVAGRVLPAAFSALVAAAVTLGIGLAAGRFQPLGVLRRNEPHPGWQPNWTFVGVASAVVALVVLAIAAASAARAGAPDRARRLQRASRVPVVAVGGGPTIRAGLDLALGRGRAMRTVIAAIAVGLAGVVAAGAFTAGLHRLTSTPERYGWPGDAAIVDAKPETSRDLQRDDRLSAVAAVSSAPVHIDGAAVTGYSFVDRQGAMDWTILAGRMPSERREVVVGSRLADRLGIAVDDSVRGGRSLRSTELRVVGIGVGPTLEGESLGRSVVLAPEGFERLAESQPFVGALVRVGRGHDRAGTLDELAARYEIARAVPPAEVANLDDLSRLPEAISLFVGVVAFGALALGVTSHVRRRSRDVAILRTIGFTPRQSLRAIALSGLVVAAIGLVAGVCAGLVIGRVVWASVAGATGVATDFALPVATVGSVVPLVALSAVGLAVLAARRAASVHPARVLMAE
jgi:putative ABC transport system permease protein